VQIRIHNSDQLLCWCVISLPVTLYLWWHCFLGKLFRPVLIGVQGLKQHWAQYRNNQRKTNYEFVYFSLAPKIAKKRKKRKPFVSQKYFFVKQMVFIKTKTGLHQFICYKYSAIWTVFVAAPFASYLQQSTYLRCFPDFVTTILPTKASFGIKGIGYVSIVLLNSIGMAKYHVTSKSVWTVAAAYWYLTGWPHVVSVI
jgi:hypothetical protein